MSSPDDAPAPAAPVDPPAESSRIGLFEALLAVAWLVVPVVQYAGTLFRTRWQLEGIEAPPFLIALDLAPVYAALLCLTVAVAVLRALRSRSVTT